MDYGITRFWFLPFADETFDCVCTHYGLDESREVAQIVQEAARVLKPGGRLVAVARANPYDRHKNIMSLFGITAEEFNLLCKKARLYSGIEDLIDTALTFRLRLTGKTVYTPEKGHHRGLLVFTL